MYRLLLNETLKIELVLCIVSGTRHRQEEQCMPRKQVQGRAMIEEKYPK